MTTDRDELGWIQTYTGRAFWPLEPRPEEVDIRDIAHHLSLICRFTGATRQHYSVAQHSVLVSMHVPECDALWGLLHDAPEAYLNDISRPLKRCPMFEAYRQAEIDLMVCIAKHFGLEGAIPPSVKQADDAALWTERRDLMCDSERPWNRWGSRAPAEPWPETIWAWPQEVAERQFLDRYEALTGEVVDG